MKAKINLTKDSSGNVLKMKYEGVKKESSLNPLYKSSVKIAKKDSDSYSNIDESVMKRKFSI